VACTHLLPLWIDLMVSMSTIFRVLPARCLPPMHPPENPTKKWLLQIYTTLLQSAMRTRRCVQLTPPKHMLCVAPKSAWQDLQKWKISSNPMLAFGPTTPPTECDRSWKGRGFLSPFPKLCAAFTDAKPALLAFITDRLKAWDLYFTWTTVIIW